MKVIVENKEIIMNKIELNQWFIKNSTDGIVNKKIVLFDEVNSIKDGEFTMSDFGLNRLGMKVDPDGWNIKNYKKNPVLLWNHDDNIPAIGNMKNVRVVDKKLVGKPVFADKETDQFAWSIGQKVEQGILTSGSVGFQTKKIEVKEKKNGGEPDIISREQELFEFSIVNLPALTSAVKNNLSDIKEDDYMEKLFIDKNEGLSIFKKEDNDETSQLNIFKKNKQGEK